MLDGSSWPTYWLPNTSEEFATSAHRLLYSQLRAMCGVAAAGTAGARAAAIVVAPATNKEPTNSKSRCGLMGSILRSEPGTGWANPSTPRAELSGRERNTVTITSTERLAAARGGPGPVFDRIDGNSVFVGKYLFDNARPGRFACGARGDDGTRSVRQRGRAAGVLAPGRVRPRPRRPAGPRRSARRAARPVARAGRTGARQLGPVRAPGDGAIARLDQRRRAGLPISRLALPRRRPLRGHPAAGRPVAGAAWGADRKSVV